MFKKKFSQTKVTKNIFSEQKLDKIICLKKYPHVKTMTFIPFSSDFLLNAHLI